MSQSSILEFLIKQPDNWFTPKEIMEAIGIKNVSHQLRVLRQFGFVKTSGRAYIKRNPIRYQIKSQFCRDYKK